MFLLLFVMWSIIHPVSIDSCLSGARQSGGQCQLYSVLYHDTMLVEDRSSAEGGAEEGSSAGPDGPPRQSSPAQYRCPGGGEQREEDGGGSDVELAAAGKMTG